jgi:FkbM family methyltransferase
MGDEITVQTPSIARKLLSVLQFLARPWLLNSPMSEQFEVLQKKVEGLSAQKALLDQVQMALRRLENCQTIYLGNFEALTRLHTQHRIYVDTRDVGIASHLMLEGRWEPWIEAAIVQTIKPGMRFVDCGANFGYYTLLGAELVGAGGHVYSFEANPSIFEKLLKSVLLNGFNDRVTLFNLAVHDESGQLEILFHHSFSGGGWTDIVREQRNFSGETRPIRAEPLDKLLADVPNIDVMKIDVEGAEPKVLAGAHLLIARSKSIRIILEFDPQRIAPHSPLDYLQQFERQGFKISIIEPLGLTPPLSAAECLTRLQSQMSYLLLSR